MAFIDNTGDIILDAVLTDIGRKRMAQGRFRITKFSPGDDEIDYSLYNKDHASGSAYYDLEILQTPILEAFTSKNANINYGLVSRARQDLLYLPQVALNQKTFSPRIVQKNADGLVLLADDSKVTAAGVITSKQITDDGGSADTILKSGDASGKFMLIETGIDSTDLLGSSANQNALLASAGLTDNNFVVSFDNRFISSVMGADMSSNLSNNSSQGAALNVTLKGNSTVRPSQKIKNNSEVVVNGVLNRVYSDTSTAGTSDTSTQFSVIKGPRASFTALNLMINPNIPQSDYNKFGTTSSDLFGTGTLYDYIDTTVYVEGAASNVNLQVPVRIIKIAQT